MTKVAINQLLRAVRKFARDMQHAESTVQVTSIADALVTALHNIRGFNSK